MLWKEFSEHIRRFPPDDQKSIGEAFQLGERLHAGQMRQSGHPYFTHPVSVARHLAILGADRDTLIAALLHDTIEDTSLTLKEIDQRFGASVATLIDGVTRLGSGELEDRPSLDEKIETLRKMFTLMQKDIRILVIKLVDRLHNMQTISFRTNEKQRAVAQETYDFYVKIADRLCMRDIRDEMESLCRRVLEPESHTALLSIRDANVAAGEREKGVITERFRSADPSLPLDIAYEHKAWEKLMLQYELQRESSDPPVLVNLTFRCPDIPTCYRTLGILHQLWRRVVLSFEDFINTPNINGYMGLHTTIILQDGRRIRCKIRTYDMDDYAHRGIAAVCFDTGKAHSLLPNLPWMQHITPLTTDTQDRSSEFWSKLQSDILTESMVVYGRDGRSALVPRGVTALDGALSLYHEQALRMTAVRVNGRDVPFVHPLERADVVEITTGSEQMVQREWLYWAKTGVGVAMVRSALSRTTDEDLVELGRTLMQREFRDHARGFLEEYDPASLCKALASIGYASTEDVYLAVANRHIEPSDVLNAMDRTNTKQPSEKQQKKDCTITFTFIGHRTESIRRFLSVFERYGMHASTMHQRPVDTDAMHFTIHHRLTQEEQGACKQDLLAIGATDVEVLQRKNAAPVLMSIVVLFWSINPVWAKYFLREGITPLTLVSIRSIGFFFLTAVLYAAWRLWRGRLYSPIPRPTFVAFLPAITSFLLAIATYFSYAHVPPSIHLTILRFNALLLPIVAFWKQRSARSLQLLALGTLIAGALIFSLEEGIVGFDILLPLLALAAYILYSLTTEHALNTHRIGARFPQFLLHLGAILGACGALLLPFVLPLKTVWLPLLPSILLYVFFCVFIPHVSFQLVLQRARFRHITSMSLAEVPLAIVFEILFLGLALQPFSYITIAVILLMFFSMIRLKIIR